MILGRRERPPLWKRIREVLWPRGGWRRATTYIAHRVRRLPGTPESIAAGFACGAAISFTPFIGLHFVLGALISWMMGGSVFASAVGTVIGNPWTFPFIWAWIFTLGRWILGATEAFPLPDDLTMAYIFEHPWRVFLPMIVGGIPTALVAWFAFFWPMKRMVAGYQHARRMARVRAYRKQRGGTRGLGGGGAPSHSGNGGKSEADGAGKAASEGKSASDSKGTAGTAASRETE